VILRTVDLVIEDDLFQMDKDAEDDIAEFEEQELQYVLMVSSHFT